MSKGRRKSRRSRRQKRQVATRSAAREAAPIEAGLDGEGDLDADVENDVENDVEGFISTPNRLGRYLDDATVAQREHALPDRGLADAGAPGSRELLAREFFVSRLNHLSRRLEEIHQAEVNRYSEERRETWILVFALAVVLIFCFAAFFMNQMEVRDLRAGLEDELERRSNQTISSIEESLDGFQLDRIPKMQSSLEASLREKEERDRQEIDALRSAMELELRRSDERYEERLKSLERSLMRLTDELSRRDDMGPSPDAIAAPAETSIEPLGPIGALGPVSEETLDPPPELLPPPEPGRAGARLTPDSR